jgi:hypothetical protein
MDDAGVGAPTGMLSGMLAAETIEMAIRKNDYSANTLKDYVQYLDSTALLRTMFDSNKLTTYMYSKGDERLPEYRESIARIMEEGMREEVDYIKREPYPFWKTAYLEVGRNFTPIPIRWLITGWVHSSSWCSKLFNLMRKMFRRRFYDWRKNYESGR